MPGIRPVLALTLLLALTSSPAFAQSADEGAPASSSEELARRSTDPTNSPPSLGFLNDLTFDYRDLADGTPIDETGYTLRLQTVVPYSAWGTKHILRMTMPYELSGPGPEGLEDLTIFDLFVIPQSWGRLGIGVVASFAATSSPAPDHARAGPAIGFMAPVSKKLGLGLFNQNLFSGETSVSQIQPIAALQLGRGWSLSFGDLQWVYDWKQSDFVSLPVGLQLGKVQPLAGQPLRFAVNPQFDLKDSPGSSRFKTSLTVTLILPEGK